MIPLVKVSFPPANVLMPKIEEVLYSGQVAEGAFVYDFEKKFVEKYGYGQGLAISSGTAALHMALILAGVEDGDEVISTAMTAEPTNTSITQAGGKIVWADVDSASGNISPESIKENITSKTKAIVVVHYAGYPCRMDEIMKIAKEKNIKVIEDCAHALGAKYGKDFVGLQADFAIFSFQAIKHMTTVDGGFLLFKDNTLLEKAKRVRWFGMLKGVPRTEVDLSVQGYKYNMNNVTAQIGLQQLQHNIDQIIERHISNGLFYDQELSKIKGIDFARCDSQGRSSYWIYTLLTDNSKDLEKLLTENGISASKLHKPNYHHSFFKSSFKLLPQLEKFYDRLLHIPCGWWVTNEDRQRIVDVIKKG
ncbi:DegT/DnrJ/EryC1/StrS family aminotransferase [Pseudobdellovibrio sp. HCB154]|uniref:DegT/DnrJ/EryC1/StrS aminotransferase family protein n=1 Tax=Pseudobdellovibrio sp. HCB154 TaxID=3386277 RepID=UPI003916F27C